MGPLNSEGAAIVPSSSDIEERSASAGIASEIALLEEAYELVGECEVRGFLRERPELVRPLRAIHEEIMRRTEAKGTATLERMVDPEEALACLAVSAEVPVSPQKVLEALGVFDEWWLDQPASIRNWIVVSLEPA
jgi:hypothetical protein